MSVNARSRIATQIHSPGTVRRPRRRRTHRRRLHKSDAGGPLHAGRRRFGRVGERKRDPLLPPVHAAVAAKRVRVRLLLLLLGNGLATADFDLLLAAHLLDLGVALLARLTGKS